MNEDHLDRWRNGAGVRQRFITAVDWLKWLKTKEKEKIKKVWPSRHHQPAALKHKLWPPRPNAAHGRVWNHLKKKRKKENLPVWINSQQWAVNTETLREANQWRLNSSWFFSFSFFSLFSQKSVCALKRPSAKSNVFSHLIVFNEVATSDNHALH